MEWVNANWETIGLVVLFVVSEVIGSIKGMPDNAVYQVVFGILKKIFVKAPV